VNIGERKLYNKQDYEEFGSYCMTQKGNTNETNKHCNPNIAGQLIVEFFTWPS
jgi:hypothetical protein